MAISIYQLKPRFQRLLAPSLAALHRLGVTPNQITLLAMLLSLGFGGLLALFPTNADLLLAVPFFMLLRMGLNAIDGMLANSRGLKTPLGALLNEMGDQISDVALYLPFALLASIHAALVLAIVIVGLLAEFAGVLALQVGAARRFDGPMGKSDRAFVFGLLALLLYVGVDAIWLNGILALTLVLLLLTVFNRLRAALAAQTAQPIH